MPPKLLGKRRKNAESSSEINQKKIKTDNIVLEPTLKEIAYITPSTIMIDQTVLMSENIDFSTKIQKIKEFNFMDSKSLPPVIMNADIHLLTETFYSTFITIKENEKDDGKSKSHKIKSPELDNNAINEEIIRLTNENYTVDTISMALNITPKWVKNVQRKFKTQNTLPKQPFRPIIYGEDYLDTLNDYIINSNGQILTLNIMKSHLLSLENFRNSKISTTKIWRMLKKLNIRDALQSKWKEISLQQKHYEIW
jgi:hypothetical protein